MTRLQTLARSADARRILEIGTGDGSGTLELAAALAPGGVVITMEADAGVAAAARQQFAAEGHGDRVSVIVGQPSRFLHKVSGPFDVIFENAESSLPHDRLLALLRSGGVLITANRKYSEEGSADAALSIQVKA